MLELALFLIAATITLMMGLPVVTRLARAPLIGRSAPISVREEKSVFHTTRLEPVDFGPVTTKWPSQMPQRHKERPELTWPSLSWDEDLFGSRESIERSERARISADTQAARVRQSAIDGAPTHVTTQSKRAAKQKRAAQKRRSASTTAPARKPAPRRPSPPPAAARELPVPASSNIPDAATVEALLAEQGLARTVRILMDQTGWDLDTVASFIAERR